MPLPGSPSSGGTGASATSILIVVGTTARTCPSPRARWSEIEALLRHRVLAREGEDLPHEITRLVRRPADDVEIVALARTFGQAPLGDLGQRHGRHQRIVELVRYAAGQCTEGLEFLRMQMMQLALRVSVGSAR
jgi:hypothetical protein